jgi:hypothetical protein
VECFGGETEGPVGSGGHHSKLAQAADRGDIRLPITELWD